MHWPQRMHRELSMTTALTSRQREVLAIYRRFHTANRHKMEPIPVVRIPDALR